MTGIKGDLWGGRKMSQVNHYNKSPKTMGLSSDN